MASPFPERLGTNYCPEDDEVDAIKAYLVGPTTKCQEVDLEIAEVQKTMNALVARRNALREDIDAHSSLISPIRRLPLDLLQRIFMETLPTDRNCVMSATEAPLLLGRVCSGWRRLADATPLLWARLHVFIPTGPHTYHTRHGGIGDVVVPPKVKKIQDQRISVLKSWLRKSEQCPISVSLYYPGFGSLQEIVDALRTFSTRWEHIVINTQSDALASLVSITPEEVPLLRAFSVVERATTRVQDVAAFMQMMQGQALPPQNNPNPVGPAPNAPNANAANANAPNAVPANAPAVALNAFNPNPNAPNAAGNPPNFAHALAPAFGAAHQNVPNAPNAPNPNPANANPNANAPANQNPPPNVGVPMFGNMGQWVMLNGGAWMTGPPAAPNAAPNAPAVNPPVVNMPAANPPAVNALNAPIAHANPIPLPNFGLFGNMPQPLLVNVPPLFGAGGPAAANAPVANAPVANAAGANVAPNAAVANAPAFPLNAPAPNPPVINQPVPALNVPAGNAPLAGNPNFFNALGNIFGFNPQDQQADDQSEQLLWETAGIIRAPHLTSLSLNTLAFNLFELPLKWEQITELNLDRPGLQDGTSISSRDTVQLLERCPNLAQFRIIVQDAQEPMPVHTRDGRPLLHDKLETFHLVTPLSHSFAHVPGNPLSSPFGLIAPRLHLTNLKTFNFFGYGGVSYTPEFFAHNFVATAPLLHTLQINVYTFAELELVDLIRNLPPSIRVLTFPLGRGNAGLFDFEMGFGVLGDAFLDSLMAPEPEPETSTMASEKESSLAALPLPKLETLEIHGRVGFSEAALLRFIEQRITCLRRVVVSFAKTSSRYAAQQTGQPPSRKKLTPVELARIKALIKGEVRGLKVELKYPEKSARIPTSPWTGLAGAGPVDDPHHDWLLLD
ncbi:F-box domain-containing protein [Mycena chlorophos]|uniref:F-box domain-containing protein n=1 Tax=Mycena chlorophos TaxID=658473 RepID=A0A8H6WHP7_MYCCL|nr:F-box domain-containing protein [Mycena chlorophos]